MRIGIIGAGNIGGRPHQRAALGHEVVVANSRGPQTLEDLAEETGATVALAAVAAQGAELVIVTIPERAIPDCPPRHPRRRRLVHAGGGNLLGPRPGEPAGGKFAQCSIKDRSWF